MGAPMARTLAAAYLQYAWTHLRWVPRLRRAALSLDVARDPESLDTARDLEPVERPAEGHLDRFERPGDKAEISAAEAKLSLDS